MIMTYDWLLWANNEPELRKKIEEALSSDEPKDLLVKDTYRLSFDPKTKLVAVNVGSEECIWRSKIVPKRITYHLVKEVINGNWDAFTEDHIFNVDEEATHSGGDS